MEGVAALSLASSVIQLVDFGLELTNKCRDVYRAGNTSQNAAMQRDADDLSRLVQSLQDSMRSSPAGGHQPTELQLCAKRCADAARDLETFLDGLRAKPGKKRDAFVKLIKTALKKDKIEELRRQLEMQQSILNTSILVDLRDRDIASKVLHKSDVGDLDVQVQAIALALTRNVTSVAGIASFMRTELEKILAAVRQTETITAAHIDRVGAIGRAHLTQELSQLELNLRESDAERLLQSLAFPEMNSRREDVHEAYAKTFEWIFEEDQTDQPFDSLVQWLTTGQGCYWISGKAGSGKSTLMNYVYESDLSKDYINKWANGQKVFRPCFFLWNPGNEMLKSLRGLFRAFVYQLLDSDRSLVSTILDCLESHQRLALQTGGRPDIFWSEKKLRSVLEPLIEELGRKGHVVCAFIDGLDELDRDHLGLCDWITDMAKQRTIKFCVSSRPLPSFKKKLASFPHLRLQDLTRNDMRTYIREEFRLKASEFAVHLRDAEVEGLFDEIEAKAEGVFLWVRLVVEDLIQAVVKGDSVEDLQARLREVPEELEDLFQHIVDRHVDRAHRKKAQEYLNLMMAASNLEATSFLVFAQATWEPLKAATPKDISLLDQETARAYATMLQPQLTARTGGLLETSDEREYPYHAEDASPAAPLVLCRANFLHRTVFEWLSGPKCPTWCSMSDDQRLVETLLKSTIFCLEWTAVHANDQSPSFKKLFSASFLYATSMQRKHGNACIELLDQLSKSLERRDRISNWIKWPMVIEFVGIVAFRSSISVVHDFTGLAISVGLIAYAMEKIQQVSPGERKAYAEYLLCCIAYIPTTLSSGYLADFVHSMHTKESANPNANVRLADGDHSTPWLACSQIFQNLKEKGCLQPMRPDGTVNNQLSELTSVVHSFLAAGADVSKSVLFSDSFRTGIEDGAECYLHYELSPLALLSGRPYRDYAELNKLRQALADHGATMICKPTSVIGEGRYRTIGTAQLSQAENEKLASKLVQYHASCQGEKATHELERCLKQIWNTADRKGRVAKR